MGNFGSDRYELAGLISQSAFSSTFRARDTQSDEIVSLQILHGFVPVDPETLKKDYESIKPLLQIKYDRLSRHLDFGEWNGTYYFAEEYRSGIFLSEAQKDPCWTDEHSFVLIEQLCKILQYCHQRGLYHKGLRPSNIILERGITENPDHLKAHILGIGQADIFAMAGANFEVGVEDCFLSPEQIGFSDIIPDARSDVYSLGVIFYNLLTESTPYPGNDRYSLLHQIVTILPVRARHTRPDLSVELDEVIWKALEKKAENRTNSITIFLSEFRQARLVNQSKGKDQVEELNHIYEGEIRVSLIERNSVLKQIYTQFDQAIRGKSGVVLIKGEAGSGKSRLGEELRNYALANRGLFLWCQATQFESQKPYSVIRDAVQQLVQASRSLPAESRGALKERIECSIGGFGRDLIHSIPELQELQLLAPEIVNLDPVRQQQRGTKTILNFLRGISCEDLPILLFIDDCQWLDPGSCEIFTKLQVNLGESNLLIVLTETQNTVQDSQEREEISFSDLLVEDHLQIQLKALSQRGVRRLFKTGLRSEDIIVKDLATVAYKRCGGNPGLLMEILKTIRLEMSDVESTKLEGLVRFQSIIPKAKIEVLMRSRWGQLSEQVNDILSLAAIIGRKFTIEFLTNFAKYSMEDIRSAIDEGCRQHLLTSWTVLEQQWHCFSSEHIHEEIYQNILLNKKQRLHAQVAQVIEAENNDNEEHIYEIAFHYLRSNDLVKAQSTCLRAAQASKRAHANVQASDFYREALKLTPKEKTIDRLEILEDFGDVLSLAGQYEEALFNFQDILEVVQDPIHRARIEGKIGDLYFRRGMNEKAIEHMTRGLNNLGFRVPNTRIGLFISIMKNVASLGVRALFPTYFKILPATKCEFKRSAIKILHSLAYALYFLDQTRTLEVHLHQLNLAESLGESVELAHTYSSHGIVCSIIPLHRRAMRFQRAGLRMREKLNDIWGVGQSYAFMGVCSYYRGALSQAVEYLQRSISTLKELGDQWEIEAAYSHLGFCYNLIGDFDAAEDANRILNTLSEEIQDQKFIAVSQTGLADTQYMRGQLDSALNLVNAALAKRADHFTIARAQRLKGQILLRQNRVKEATEIVESSLKLIEEHNLQNEYLVPNYLTLAKVYLNNPDDIANMAVGERRGLLRRIKKLLKKGMSLSRKFPNVLGYAYRVRGIYHFVTGKIRIARKDFSYSRRVLERQGRHRDYSRAVIEEAFWLKRKGLRVDHQAVEKAADFFKKIGAKLDLQEAQDLLGSSYNSIEAQRSQNGSHHISILFNMTKAISSNLDLEQLVLQITDLAISMTQGERGIYFSCFPKDKPEIRCARGMNRNDISIQLPTQCKELIDGVIASGVAKNYLFGEENDMNWSVMCVPIQLNEKMFAVLYIDNRSRAHVYNDDDLEILSVFASQAAIAIHNALLYRRAEELNLRLEQKIQERTFELVKSKDALEKANRLKSEFLANMSHELRTPLNAIIAMSEIMIEKTFGPLNEKQEIYLQQVLDSGVHLLSLINDVLDLSKVEAGQLDLEMDPFLIEDVLKGSLLVVKENAYKKDISLELNVDKEVGIVPGDARRIKQVLYNLLSNAIKFTPRGGKVTISAIAEQSSVIVSVIDTGIGISEEDISIIFDEFRQVDSSYSRHYDGTGLGLALSRKFIEMHHGKIWVESEVGTGSQFCFLLPLEFSTSEGVGKPINQSVSEEVI